MIRVVVLNGPLGIGKSSLQDALVEAIDGAAGIDGDAMLQLNPEPEGAAYLNDAIGTLAGFHLAAGFRTFVVNHIWTAAEDLEGLRARFAALDPDLDWHVLLLTLPIAEHRARVQRRQMAREADETEFEAITLTQERAALEAAEGTMLGEPFCVDAPMSRLTDRVLRLIGSSR